MTDGRGSRRRGGMLLLSGLLAAVLCASSLVWSGVAGAATGQTLYSWGDFGSNNPVSPIVATPQAIAGVPGTIIQIVSSNSNTFALTSAGTLWALGVGQYGELGNGDFSNSFTTPVQVQFPAGVSIASLPDPMPYDTPLAIDRNGNIWGWGFNGDGELCLGSADTETLPQKLPFSDVTLASGGGYHIIYDAGGIVYACGSDKNGELGNGVFSSKDKTHRVIVKGLPTGTVTSLVSSYAGSGALMTDGSYWDWGLNDHGQLGNGSTANSALPVQVSLPAIPTSLFQGGNDTADGQTLAVLTNGQVVSWGSDKYGQLCNRTLEDAVTTPQPVKPPAGATWVTVRSGGTTSYAVDSTGQLWACGSNRNGEIGNGMSTTTPQKKPVVVLSHVIAVSSTSHDVSALTSP